MNILGMDWGSRRVGLALGSEEARLARPHLTLANDIKLKPVLKAICTENNVGKIVLGLPRNMSGSETAQSQQVRHFGEKLSKDLNIPVLYQDESLTSRVAQEAATAKPEDRDTQAAAIILQDYLDTARP